MKRMLKGLFSLGALLSAGAMLADDCCTTDCAPCGGHPYFSYRSQSINAARELVGWQSSINKFEMESLYGSFKITPEYTHSWRSCRMAGFFFGDDLQSGELTVSGSRKATARGSHEWLADNFGLSPDFESTVKFEPRISNFLVDLNLYLGLDEMWEGAFFRIHAPIVWTKWKFNMCESVTTAGTLDFDAGYMDEDAVAVGSLPANFEAAMKGVTFGDMTEALKYDKIDCSCDDSKLRLSDIEVALGWNFMQDEDYHFGLAIRGSFPTGNKPCPDYLFTPVVGSGGHWMLGGGLTSHVDLWTSDDEESTFCAYLDANVGHYFRANQTRSFDLINKKNSRYMLISELDTSVTNLYYGATYNAPTVAPSHQYTEKLFPLINKTTFCTDVSIAIQGDLALKFAYTNGNFCFDLGYNLWARSGEKFKQDCCDTCGLASGKFALKGDAFVIGWSAADGTATQNIATPLSATESLATINGGTNTPTGTVYAAGHRYNPSIDNAALAWSVTGGAVDDSIQYATGINHAAGTQQHTSSTPKFLSCSDLNMCKTPSALSHKVFANLNYTWADDAEEDEWIPFVGIGGELEFAPKSDSTYSAASQWGIWVEGGLSFD